MFDITLLFIYEKNMNFEEIKESLDRYSPLFKKIVIGAKDPESIIDLDYEIVMPIKGDSIYSILYSGLYILGDEKIAAVSSKSEYTNMEDFLILLKNLHGGVDAAMFMENKEIIPLPGIYSNKIINKFRDSEEKNFEQTFLKRLKINKILRR